ncbi:transposase [Pseudoalteromonas sp.]|uniref:transposase n=1 Tax=Pseudoalteromonas sp. TaxID=53249 RepID=UPI002636AC24|nr:transposase [Pseudoalteromonas sp.]MCP4587657.1 transposase [Pseudoalteromonas sp.]
MSERRYNRHNKEFKLEAVKRSFEPGKTAAEVARELDIQVTLLYKWREQFEKKQGEAFSGKSTNNSSNELESLRKEVKRLRQERDILKKSLIFFARDEDNDSDSSEDIDRSSR